MKPEEIEKRIIEFVKKNPEGVSLTQIAEHVGIHRVNIAKYVYKLVGAGLLKERIVGPAKLYYLKHV